jgi:serine/threonine-protein kinase RsbT
MSDVAQARRDVRQFAAVRGFGPVDAEAFALVVSELGTNLIRHARGGVLTVEWVADTSDQGGRYKRVGSIQVSSVDHGPGISNLDEAMQDGFSTGGGLGSGLPAVRRLMDTFAIESDLDGTRVVATKWLTTRS